MEKFVVEYFNEKILEIIKCWPDDIYADYVRVTEMIELYGPKLRLPHSRAMGGSLFELRARGASGDGRAFYCFGFGKRVVVLHAFRKKTRATPDGDLAVARRRLKELSYG